MIVIEEVKIMKKPVIWKKLIIKIGSAAAFIAALVFRRNLDAEYSLLYPLGIMSEQDSYPTTIVQWFLLFQEKPLTGLLLMNFFDLVNSLLVGLLFLAVVISLYYVNKPAIRIAALLSTAAILLHLSTNQSLAYLALSRQYAFAVTENQSNLISTGQALLKIHESNSFQGAGVYWSYLFLTFAGLILSLTMLKSSQYSKFTAYLGILTNGFGLIYIPFLIFSPGFIFIPLSLSAPFLLVWYILIGCQLLNLSKDINTLQTKNPE